VSQNAGTRDRYNWIKARIHKSWARIQMNPPVVRAAAFVVISEPHTEARPSFRFCVEPELARCVHYSHNTDMQVIYATAKQEVATTKNKQRNSTRGS
jgi:hypothetical protein